jgi:hypothetical protein
MGNGKTHQWQIATFNDLLDNDNKIEHPEDIANNLASLSASIVRTNTTAKASRSVESSRKNVR